MDKLAIDLDEFIPSRVGRGAIDTIKINGLTVMPKVIPEPGSLALIGIASLGLLFRRRKGARTV